MTEKAICLFNKIAWKPKHDAIDLHFDEIGGRKLRFRLFALRKNPQLDVFAKALGHESFQFNEPVYVYEFISDNVRKGTPIIIEHTSQRRLDDEGEYYYVNKMIDCKKFEGVIITNEYGEPIRASGEGI